MKYESLQKRRLFCCFKTIKEDEIEDGDSFGSCIICREYCTSQACECSFFHEECMHNYNMHEYDSSVCPICNTKYCKTNLQPCPVMTKREKQELNYFNSQTRINNFKIFIY